MYIKVIITSHTIFFNNTTDVCIIASSAPTKTTLLLPTHAIITELNFLSIFPENIRPYLSLMGSSGSPRLSHL